MLAAQTGKQQFRQGLHLPICVFVFIVCDAFVASDAGTGHGQV